MGVPSCHEEEGSLPRGLPGKDGFHTFKLHLRANHLTTSPFVEDKIVDHELRGCQMDFNRSPVDNLKIRCEPIPPLTDTDGLYFHRSFEGGFGRLIILEIRARASDFCAEVSELLSTAQQPQESEG